MTRAGDVFENPATLVNSSYPTGTNAWSGVAFNSGSSARGITVTAVCAPVSATG